MFTKQFWQDVTVRALKTWAQAGVALLGTGAFGLFSLDLVNFASVTLGAAFVSVLTSIASVDTVGTATIAGNADTAEVSDTTTDDTAVDELVSSLPSEES